MSKWVKILLVLLVVTPVVTVMAVAVLVNPNDYKPELETLVSEQTNRDFQINGDIGLTVFPWLGFEAEGLTLANHAEFSQQPMFQLERAAARLKLLPLFTGRLQIAVIELRGLAATLGIKTNGQPSWEDLLANETDDAEATTSATDDGGETVLPDFSLTKLDISGASLTWLDKPAASTSTIKPLNLTIGNAQAGEPFPLTAGLALEQLVDGVATTVDAELESRVLLDTDNGQIRLGNTTLKLDASIPGLQRLQGQISTTITAALDGSSAEMSNLNGELNGMTMSGQLSAKNLLAKPNVKATLQLGELIVEQFVAVSETEASEEAAATDSDTLNNTVVDVSALHSVNAAMDLGIELLSASGMRLTDAKLQAMIKDGLLTVQQLNADLYQGQFRANAAVDARGKQPSYRWEHTLKGVEAELLQQDVMEKAYITGVANMTTAVTLAGNTIGELRQKLNGQGDLRFEDGAIKGINVAGALRKAFAAYKKQPVPEGDGEVLDTDFAAATASFTITDGVLNNPDMLVESPLIRITGAGDINLVNETLNYRAKPVVVASLEGQGGRSLDDIDGLPIPVKCTGALQAPDCSTDFSGLLKDEAKAAFEAEKARAEEKLAAERERLREREEAAKKEAEAKAKKKLEEKADELLKKWR